MSKKLSNMSNNKCLIEDKNIIIRGSFGIKIYPDGNGFIIAECPELKTMGWGTTEEEAQEVLEQRNLLLFEELIEKNQLAVELAKLGWDVTEDGMNILICPPVMIRVKNLGVDEFFETKALRINHA
jgi:hypothetical protein